MKKSYLIIGGSILIIAAFVLITMQYGAKGGMEHKDVAMHAQDGAMHDMASMATHHAHQHANPDEAKLIEEITKGGYVLFVRHERTELSKTFDIEPTNYADCSTQRNLSPSGIASAKEIGEALNILGIPTTASYSSPYCRARETAMHEFGETTVVQTLSGRASNAESFDVMKAGAYLNEFLATLDPKAGENIAIVAHWGNFNAAFGKHIHEGDMAVLKKGASGFVYVGAIHPATWSDVIHDAERMSVMMMPQ